MTMILTGQYDSPFVRRAAVALNHHGVAFERRVLSVFADFDAMLTVNPLGKVPVLSLDDGRVLPDSRAIIEWLDLGARPEHRLLPEGDAAIAVLAIEAVAIGLAEKTYERGLLVGRNAPGKPDWIDRLERQIGSALDWLSGRVGPGWTVDDRISRADLAIVVALTYLAEKAPTLYTRAAPALAAFRDRSEALPVFAASPYSANEAAASGWRPEAR